MIETLIHRPWKVLKSENILRIGPWLSVRQECVQLPSGKQIPTWFILEYPNWINVIALTKDGQLVMIDQYRHGLGVTKYEIVAGVIDQGETPLQAAQRERISNPHQESTEDIHVHVMDPSDVFQLLREGEIPQALHAAPLWKFFATEYPLLITNN